MKWIKANLHNMKNPDFEEELKMEIKEHGHDVPESVNIVVDHILESIRDGKLESISNIPQWIKDNIQDFDSWLKGRIPNIDKYIETKKEVTNITGGHTMNWLHKQAGVNELGLSAKQLTDYFDYLDNLRESGATNMFGAGAYLERDMELSKNIARTVLAAWMETFDNELSMEERVKNALEGKPQAAPVNPKVPERTPADYKRMEENWSEEARKDALLHWVKTKPVNWLIENIEADYLGWRAKDGEIYTIMPVEWINVKLAPRDFYTIPIEKIKQLTLDEKLGRDVLGYDENVELIEKNNLTDFVVKSVVVDSAASELSKKFFRTLPTDYILNASMWVFEGVMPVAWVKKNVPKEILLKLDSQWLEKYMPEIYKEVSKEFKTVTLPKEEDKISNYEIARNLPIEELFEKYDGKWIAQYADEKKIFKMPLDKIIEKVDFAWIVKHIPKSRLSELDTEKILDVYSDVKDYVGIPWKVKNILGIYDKYPNEVKILIHDDKISSTDKIEILTQLPPEYVKETFSGYYLVKLGREWLEQNLTPTEIMNKLGSSEVKTIFGDSWVKENIDVKYLKEKGYGPEYIFKIYGADVVKENYTVTEIIKDFGRDAYDILDNFGDEWIKENMPDKWKAEHFPASLASNKWLKKPITQQSANKSIVHIYYKEGIDMKGRGITRVTVNGEEMTSDQFFTLLIEEIGQDLISFWDDEIHVYINGDFAGYSINFDAKPEIDVDKYNEWLDANYDIKFIPENKEASLSKKAHECPKCGKAQLEKEYIVEEKTGEEGDDYEYGCPVCGKAFSRGEIELDKEKASLTKKADEDLKVDDDFKVGDRIRLTDQGTTATGTIIDISNDGTEIEWDDGDTTIEKKLSGPEVEKISSLSKKADEEEISNVWILESPDEQTASDILNMDYIQPAFEGDKIAQKFLVKLWDNESWESIKEKLETEGSVWYVWWMDGVSAFMNILKENASLDKKALSPAELEEQQSEEDANQKLIDDEKSKAEQVEVDLQTKSWVYKTKSPLWISIIPNFGNMTDTEKGLEDLEDLYGIDIYGDVNHFMRDYNNTVSKRQEEYDKAIETEENKDKSWEDYFGDDEYQEEIEFEVAFDKYVEEDYGNWGRFEDAVTEPMPFYAEDYSEVRDEITRDFNEAKLEQYCDEIKGIKKILIDTDDESSDSMIVSTYADHELSADEIKELESYLSGQYSDGWGEGFEQHDQSSDKLVTIYINTWNRNGFQISTRLVKNP